MITVVDKTQHYLSEIFSTNGTFLDEEKLQPLLLYPISNNSIIRIADTELKYVKVRLIHINFLIYYFHEICRVM